MLVHAILVRATGLAASWLFFQRFSRLALSPGRKRGYGDGPGVPGTGFALLN
jgi:hypothetical protein